MGLVTMGVVATDGGKIVVVGRFEAGSLLAHVINSIKMAQGFARLGHRVVVVCRRGEAGPWKPADLAERYALDRPLSWVQLPPRLGVRVRGFRWRYDFAALAAILRHRPRLVYARGHGVATLTTRIGLPTAIESHVFPGTPSREVEMSVVDTRCRAFRAWVTISEHLAGQYRRLGADPQKLLVLPDAVDLQQFARPERLPPSPYPIAGPHVVYAGHLYDYKGIPTILDAARRMPEVRFHLVGGLPEDLERQRARARQLGLTNLEFHGLKSQCSLPPYVWHADALLLPPSQHHPSAVWTSPVKLGEYLAARVPVVSSDIPALRHLLTDDQVEFFCADDASDLTRALCRVLTDRQRRHQLVNSGWRHVQSLTYEQRAQRILEFAKLSSPSPPLSAALR